MRRKAYRFSVCVLVFSAMSFSCTKPGPEEGPDNNPADKIEVSLEEGMDYCGVVTDTDGNPVSGVTVSDGFNCTVTDSYGIYQLKKGSDFSAMVNISIPSEYEVPIEDGLPCFWKKIEKGQPRYDFILRKSAVPENEFYLFTLADPQCQNNTRHTVRFSNETVPDLKASAQKYGAQASVYAITLGDIGYNTSDKEYNIGSAVFSNMKRAMHVDKTSVPIFQVMGNHDNNLIAENKSYSVEMDIEMEKYFTKFFGPVNYSFNRGNAHIIAMDDILCTNPESSYNCGFRDDQVEWLKQDLANVPKDKMIILCVHIPFYYSSSGQNVKTVLNLISGYAESHVMSGHTHRSINTPNTCNTGIYEHTHGAVCGAWWWSTVNTDGTPNGYGVYKIEGSHVAWWKYKGVGLEDDNQIRMYRGNTAFMTGQAKTYYFAKTTASDLWANIWNWDSSWTVDVYEDGKKTGSMSRYTNDNDSTGDARDAWAVGYHVGVTGRGATSYDKKNVKHLLHFTLKNPQAQVEIRATDRFGNVYSQKEFTDGTSKYWPIAPGDSY